MDNIIADEIIIKVFAYLDIKSLLNCSKVSRRWYNITKSQTLWRPLVFTRWPSQRWLYETAEPCLLNWYKIYQELTNYGWFSPDHMKYFVSCSRFEDEPITLCLRRAIIEKIKIVTRKWIPASVLDHNGSMLDTHFDDNMELYFDTRKLEWIFLDKRRGYMSDLFSFKNKSASIKNKSHFVRPYQVIPSCLLMYRWLSIFRLYASPQQLTFYRIWRFQLKHLETGLIFELYDWKAAMATSFVNGRPKIKSYLDDGLELLHLLTHPNFFMHLLGDENLLKSDPTIYNMIHATAGGCIKQESECSNQTTKKVKGRKRKFQLSPSASVNTLFSANSADVLYHDLNDRIKKWRERRKNSLLESSSSSLTGSSNSSSSSLNQSNLNVLNALQSDNASDACSSVSDGSNETTDTESEIDLCENGFVTNCEYFISNVHEGFDSIEEQHSIQASIADNWLFTREECQQPTMVLYNVNEEVWYFTEPTIETLVVNKGVKQLKLKESSTTSDNENKNCNKEVGNSENEVNEVSGNENEIDVNEKQLSTIEQLQQRRNVAGCVVSGVVEPISSPLALYRLICLFDLNTDLYVCNQFNHVWSLCMQHKRTGGIIHFRDINGFLQVNAGFSNITDNDSDAQFSYDLDEFRASVTQLLDLLMHESFCHPFGSVAGAVA